MIYALVHFPNMDSQSLHQFRIKYDPQVKLIAPHITLMFPVSESIGKDRLVHHLENILKNGQSFPIHLQRVQFSSDDHVFLLLEEGHTNMIRLHDDIYTGILADHQNKDIPFIPHLTLGVLNKDSNQYEDILKEERHLGIDYCGMLDKLNLAKVNDDRSKIVWSKEFCLSV